ncbi:WbuC family cupin fold metalloprotein [Thermodesulfobacteriota bacterium]
MGCRLFKRLIGETDRSERKRTHYNLHPNLDDPVQRLCVAIDPGSYIRPHRHSAPGKWELFVALIGSATLLVFDESGRIIERNDFSGNGPVYVVEVPENTWHTLAAVIRGTVLVEIKPGPYTPITDGDLAPWSPAEGTEKAALFEKQFRMLPVGSRVA